MQPSMAGHCTAQTGSFACLFGCSLLARPLRLGSQRVGSLCSVVSLTLPLQTPSIAWFTSNSKHWFTTSFLAGKRCSECGFTCICPPPLPPPPHNSPGKCRKVVHGVCQQPFRTHHAKTGTSSGFGFPGVSQCLNPCLEPFGQYIITAGQSVLAQWVWFEFDQ